MSEEKKTLTSEEVQEMRAAMGTLPSQSPKKNYKYADDISSIEVNMTDWTKNPYKVIVAAVSATWGNDETGSMGKWAKLSPANRYRLALSHLTGNTLPQAAEGINFQFEINGVSRHDFDQHARARVGTHFMSIGTRDNNKLDSTFLFYDHIMQRMEQEPEYKAQVEAWIKITKDLYETTIIGNESSWQMGRAFLPQSIKHSYVFGSNLIALKGQMSRRLQACEQEGIVALHWKIRALVEDKFPLIANFFKPGCDFARRCTYMEGAEGLTKYFSNLYAGCGRWKVKDENNSAYKEFNHSCTSYERLKEFGIPVVDVDGYKHFTENDYEMLDPKDKALFEEE